MATINQTVWEVFGQRSRGDAHTYAGSFLGPDDPEMALVLARENFVRRREYVNLWVVPRDQIHRTPSDVDLSEPVLDKSYRYGIGYRGTVEKWRKFRRPSRARRRSGGGDDE